MFLILLEEIFVQVRRWCEAAETTSQQVPATLFIVGVGVPPHLIGYLSQYLISQAHIRQALLDDIISKHNFLDLIEERVTHEPQYLEVGKNMSLLLHYH